MPTTVLRNKLKKQKPSKETVEYLDGRSKWCFYYAVNTFVNKAEWDEYLEIALNNLSYALSFNAFSQRYRLGSSVLTLDDIDDPLLSEIRSYCKSFEYGRSPLRKDDVNNYIPRVRKHLSL